MTQSKEPYVANRKQTCKWCSSVLRLLFGVFICETCDNPRENKQAIPNQAKMRNQP